MPTLEELIAGTERRRRAEDALAYARATGQDLALRDIPTPAGSRPYLVDAQGAITAPLAHDRPLAPEEYAALDRALGAAGDSRFTTHDSRGGGEADALPALAALYAPERRARAVPYAPSAYLGPDALGARREEAMWARAATRRAAQDLRAERVRALLADERAYGNAPSDRQRAAAERWADARALTGDTRTRQVFERRDRLAAEALARADRLRAQDVAAETARQASADDLAEAIAQADAQRAAADLERRGTLAVAQEETRRAKAANANALALERLRGENALGLAGANNASSERVAQIRAQANRDVALLQGTLAAARAQGALSPEQDAAFKRAETLVRLSQSLARGGLDETALFTLDNEIDNDKTLSPEEKAARKAQLRQNNPEAVSWLLGAAARQMEAAGLPGMPAPGAPPTPAAPAPGALAGLADWR